jgi:hypothetical protein
MLRISLLRYLRTEHKALPAYLLNISIPEEFLSIYNPAPLGDDFALMVGFQASNPSRSMLLQIHLGS